MLYRINWFEAPWIFTSVGHIVISLAFAIDIIESAKVKSMERGEPEKAEFLLDRE